MNRNSTIKEYIEESIHTSSFAVLATEVNGQPHTSLIAVTPSEDCRQLIFATYRNTLKYRNLANNSKVAVLIERTDTNMKDRSESCVLTIIGHTVDLTDGEKEVAYQAHLKRHPEMEAFMLSSDCALMIVVAHSYQVVNGIDDVRWVKAEDLDAG